MTCGGCSGAVERVLKKREGIKERFAFTLEYVWPSTHVKISQLVVGRQTSCQ